MILIKTKIEINTQNFKKQNSVPRQVEHSHCSQSPCAKAQITKVQMSTPKSSIQKQKNISKIAYPYPDISVLHKIL